MVCDKLAVVHSGFDLQIMNILQFNRFSSEIDIYFGGGMLAGALEAWCAMVICFQQFSISNSRILIASCVHIVFPSISSTRQSND